MNTNVENRTQNTTRSIAWGVIAKIVGIIMPFLVRTVMIYTMGMIYTGLSSLFTSILQVLSLAELGVGSALVFSMYEPMANADDDKVCALLNFYRKAYRIIGLVILIVGLAIMPFISYLIEGDVPNEVNLYILFGIYLLNNVLGYFLFAYKQSVLQASQRIDVINKIEMVLKIVSSLAQILSLVLLHNYYAYAIVTPIITCINNLFTGYITDKLYPEYVCKGELDKKELNSIKKNVRGMIYQKVGGVILISVDSLVISFYLGLTQLALYQNYYYIFQALSGFLGVITTSLVPAIGNTLISNSIEDAYRGFKKFNFMYVAVVSWCSVCLLTLYQPFMELWVGKENMLGTDMLILFFIYFFVCRWCDILGVYLASSGLWWENRFTSLIGALVNFTLNIILVKIIGLPGIVISTIISQFFAIDVGYSITILKRYFNKIKDALKEYWKNQLYYLFCVLLAGCVMFYLTNYFIVLNTALKQFLVNGILCVIIPTCILLLMWKRLPEYKEAKEFLFKNIKSKKVSA